MVDRLCLNKLVIISVVVVIIDSFVGRVRPTCLVVDGVVELIVRVDISVLPGPSDFVFMVDKL